jgi:hypothetical protein
MKFDRNAFSKLLLRKFAFLTKEFGLRRKDLGAADEFVDRYQSESLAVTITLSYPELPFAIVAVRKPRPVAYRYRAIPDRTAATLKRQYYDTLKRHPTSHQLLTKLQTQFADLLASEIRLTVVALIKNPPALPGETWTISSHRFPS